jgi:hypothetical protein
MLMLQECGAQTRGDHRPLYWEVRQRLGRGRERVPNRRPPKWRPSDRREGSHEAGEHVHELAESSELRTAFDGRNSSTFGKITSVQTAENAGNRTGQVALRIEF